MSIKPIEEVNKFFTSLSYRVILSIVAIAILIIENNIFSWPWYLLAFIVYIYVSTVFRVVKPEQSLARLIADYALITLVLYGKGLDTFINSCFIIIPIVNSVNHTSYLKNGAGIFRLYTGCLLSMLILSHFHIKYSWLVTFFALGAISALTKLREIISRIDVSALSSIGDYHGENLRLGNSYLLLKKFISDWQSHRLLAIFFGKPVSIVTFKRIGNRLRLISSSNFVKNYVFLDELEVVSNMIESATLYNIEVLIDDAVQKPNVCIRLNGQIDVYFFYIEFDKEIKNGNIFDTYVVSALARSLSFVVKVLDNEGLMIKDRNELMRKVNSRISIMDRTINVVHFINNRLTPIVNFFEMYVFYKEQEKISKNHPYLPELAALIEVEQRKAKDSLTQIDVRSKSLLKRANEIRIEDASIVIKYKQLVRFIRDSWLDHNFLNDEIKIGWSEAVLESSLSMDVNELWLVIEEIATNIGKYSRGKSRVNFIDDEFYPSIVFTNELNASGNIIKSRRNKSFIEQFNNNELNEIMKRDSRGLFMIRSFCNKYGIVTKAELGNGIFALVLTFSLR